MAAGPFMKIIIQLGYIQVLEYNLREKTNNPVLHICGHLAGLFTYPKHRLCGVLRTYISLYGALCRGITHIIHTTPVAHELLRLIILSRRCRCLFGHAFVFYNSFAAGSILRTSPFRCGQVLRCIRRTRRTRSISMYDVSSFFYFRRTRVPILCIVRIFQPPPISHSLQDGIMDVGMTEKTQIFVQISWYKNVYALWFLLAVLHDTQNGGYWLILGSSNALLILCGRIWLPKYWIYKSICT